MILFILWKCVFLNCTFLKWDLAVLCVCVCLHVCMCTVCMLGAPQRSEEGIQSLVTGVTGSYKPPYGCWELNLGHQHKLLTVQQSLQLKLSLNLYNVNWSYPSIVSFLQTSSSQLRVLSFLLLLLKARMCSHLWTQPPVSRYPLWRVQKWKTSNTYVLILKICWSPTHTTN